MKKIICSILIAILIFTICLPFSTFADMGMPSIQSYNVHVGADGLIALYYDNNSTQKVAHLPFGQKITIYDKYSETDWGIKFEHNGATRIATITDSELQKMFQEKNMFSTGYAQPYPHATGKINDKKGLNVRYGPAVGFDRIFGVKYNETVTIDYVYVDYTVSSQNRWGYITYKNKTGWVCLDYVTETAAPSSQAPSSQTPSSVAPATSSPDSLPSNDGVVSSFSQPTQDATQANVLPFLKSRTFLILAICFGIAIILAGVAGVTIVLIMQSKKNKADQPLTNNMYTQYNNPHNYTNNIPVNNNIPPYSDSVDDTIPTKDNTYNQQ